jgi:hypothetical protein
MPQVSSKLQRRNGAGLPGQTAPAARAEGSAVSDEAIARRAYEKFLARGCVHGSDQADWVQATQELLAEADKH